MSQGGISCPRRKENLPLNSSLGCLNALSVDHTLSERSDKYSEHPNQISQWKRRRGSIVLEKPMLREFLYSSS